MMLKMSVRSLIFSLFLLASFTLSSIVFFEIFTDPPIVRQEREVYAIAFTSDLNLDHDEYTSDSGHIHTSSFNPPQASTTTVTTASIQRKDEVGARALLGAKPRSTSKVGVQRATLQPATILPTRLSGMQRLNEQSARNGTSLVPRGKYANAAGSNIRVRHRYVNRNLTKINATRDVRRRRVPPSRPRRSGLNCSDSLCVSYLLDQDYRSFTVCQQWAEKRTQVNHLSINATCKFMKGVNRQPVGLVSVPGSGNTWVRGLLEKATGVCTGSIYCDHALRNGGLIGEYVKTGRVLVVKTHTSDYQWMNVKAEKRNNDDALYSSAILLIRNPFDAFIAEWNRLNAFSAYSGKPIEPRKRVYKHRTVSNHPRSVRKAPPISLSKLNATSKRTRWSEYKHKVLSNSQKQSLLPKRIFNWNERKRESDIVQVKDKALDSASWAEPQIGQKLLSLPGTKQKEDASHTIAIGKEMFGNNTEWNKYIYEIGERWQKTILKWFVMSANFSRPVMVVKYEDIKRDQATQVNRMLNFLEVPFNNTDLKAKLNSGFDVFRRPHKEEFEHYSPRQKKYINEMLLKTTKILSQHNMENLFHLEEYLDMN